MPISTAVSARVASIAREKFLSRLGEWELMRMAFSCSVPGNRMMYRLSDRRIVLHSMRHGMPMARTLSISLIAIWVLFMGRQSLFDEPAHLRVERRKGFRHYATPIELV